MTDLAVTEGCLVTLQFVLQLGDGTLVDRSDESEPLTLTVGRGNLAAGLERCLIGLHAGDKRHFEVAASDAYGPRLAENVRILPRSHFPAEMALEPGTVIGFTLPTGEEVPGRIMATEDADVAVDFSHPLAGHDLVFDVEIISVEPPPVGPGHASG